MIGAVLVVIAMVIAGPVALFVGGAVWSALIGWFSVDDAEARYEGSEYLEHRVW